MIRSFVTLAATLNLSHAVKELDSTRQTVRRHIAQLEAAMGAPLFLVEERRYSLTSLGQSVLPDAQDILARGKIWLSGQSRTVGVLQRLQANVGDWDFYQQQQPLGKVWSDPSLLLRETLRAWTMACGEIESRWFSHVRPYLIIYRQSDIGWICVEFGEKSVYVKWFGLDYARSSIGRPISQLPAGIEFSNLIYEAFEEVQAAQVPRLDHVFTRMPRGGSDDLAPVAYQRLIFSGSFPDGSPAVMSLVLPVQEVNIADLDPKNDFVLDAVEQFEFPPEEAVFEKLLDDK
ncbi:LysR family transcriptional regulator [Sulfitobacter sp. M57]|nr:LysR family transcriptional regulator [Sulfitobacter sp. KE5]MDF3423656.1 LysR family transcriptional regulator [Sulfitobacter sp. KE43]MDF3434723.1 LysR family transcriptional regulator [Sulfitobacter sp. KE42]MDF3460362.1 LysR family transcriptional regulator [Sulfitobacter sp. S74]MDF3464260.1 LysR family transcriptional regulator [Sulfitobacter sp. Ks18]MDF3468168.1 LysR family transcriptional regulator [Sulfitobacter sp. M05]MDF3472055.1 LysR family transcriptional regulator [Sulfitob